MATARKPARKKNASRKTTAKKTSNTSKNKIARPKVDKAIHSDETALSSSQETPSIPVQLGEEGLPDLGNLILQNSIEMTSAMKQLSAFLGASLFGGPEGVPLLPALIQNQITLGQQLAGVINQHYVKIETYQQLAKQYNDLLAAYNQGQAVLNQLKTENQQYINALNQRTANQTILM